MTLWKCLKRLAVLVVVTIILQIVISTKYNSVKVIRWHNNSSFTLRDDKIDVVTHTNINIVSNKENATETVKVQGNKQPETPHIERHEGHNGYQLAASTFNACANHKIPAPGAMNRVHVFLQKRLLYCPMEKIGTTFWRRLFYMITSKDPSKYATPYDVPIKLALENTRVFTQPIQTAKSRNLLSESSFSFLFVRNPYSRVLSAFIDKIVPPNPYYWKNLGGKAVSIFRPNQQAQQPAMVKGRPAPRPTYPVAYDVTFGEFLKLATAMEKSNRGVDPHILSTNKGCKPCTYPYKYIGRMETFKDDALYIMKKLGMNASTEIMYEKFSYLSLYDAIEDSVESPFSWKKEVIKYISWDKALQRIWLKLQMRGIISMDIPLALTPDRIDTITSKEFIQLALIANKESNPTKLKEQKDLVKREAFASVPINDVIAFRDAFKEDFELFGYDLTPSYIFDRKEDVVQPTLFFNYSHLN
ncbi:hypothetical protein ACF0H5_012372 [Mactra antiquata]